MKKIILLGISGLFLFGCNNTTNKTTDTQEAETHTTQIEETHAEDASATPIDLNNGEKWIVNEEMVPYVINGEDLVDAYISENKTDYKELAEQLKEQNNLVIKTCTMKGRSHDELHKWLHPHIELVNELEKESEPALAEEIIYELQESYKEYHKYFN